MRKLQQLLQSSSLWFSHFWVFFFGSNPRGSAGPVPLGAVIPQEPSPDGAAVDSTGHCQQETCEGLILPFPKPYWDGLVQLSRDLGGCGRDPFIQGFIWVDVPEIQFSRDLFG